MIEPNRYTSRTIVKLVHAHFCTAKEFVRYLVDFFSMHDCQYTSAIAWRQEAFSKGIIVSREHSLTGDGQALLIVTIWKNMECYNQYKNENAEALNRAKKIIEKFGGEIQENLDEKQMGQFEVSDCIVFDQYRLP